MGALFTAQHVKNMDAFLLVLIFVYFIFRVREACRHYQTKNMFNLYDAISTLAEVVCVLWVNWTTSLVVIWVN